MSSSVLILIKEVSAPSGKHDVSLHHFGINQEHRLISERGSSSTWIAGFFQDFPWCRQALADFLRTRRARLQPVEVDLPSRSRRRTPGLRREEVAELADMGVSWYTLLEQGHDVHPSRNVLERMAQALRFTTAEKQHLYLLAGMGLPAKVVAEEAQITTAFQRVVDALNPLPAFVIGRRWDVLTWNRAADLLFHFHEPYPPHSRNVVWRFFNAPRHAPSTWIGRYRHKTWWRNSARIMLAILVMPLFRKLLKTCSG